VRWSFVSVAVWWFVFLLPLALNVQESVPVRPSATWREPRAAACASWRTLREISPLPRARLFLVAYWLYIDAVNTIIKMAVDYGVALGCRPRPARGAAADAVRGLPGGAVPSAGSVIASARKRGILIGIGCLYSARHRVRVLLDSVVEFFGLAVVIGPGAGRRAEPVALVVRGGSCREGKNGRVLRLLQHDGQVRDRDRSAARRRGRP
jgi:UMF1 family MFS transporter